MWTTETKIIPTVRYYSITCNVCDSLKVNSKDYCRAIQRTVLERIRGKSVVGCIPQAAAADLHALSSELANVDQDDYLISGDHEVLHTSSYHLQYASQTINFDESKKTLMSQNF